MIDDGFTIGAHSVDHAKYCTVTLDEQIRKLQDEIDDIELGDAPIAEAGILGFYADHVDQATTIPDPAPPPRRADNRPYPAGP